MHLSVHQALYKVFDDGIVQDPFGPGSIFFSWGCFCYIEFWCYTDPSLDPNHQGPVDPRACEYVDDWDRWHIFGVTPKMPEVKQWTEYDLKEQLLQRLSDSGALSPQLIGRFGNENIVILHHFNRDEIRAIGVQQLAILAGEFDVQGIKFVFENGILDDMTRRAWAQMA